MIRPLYVVIAATVLTVIVSCSALTGWLNEPVEPATPTGTGGDVGTSHAGSTFDIPGVGQIVITVPPAKEQSFDVPGLGKITITPTTAPTSTAEEATPAPTTKGDVVASVGGGIIGQLTGIPLIGLLAASLLKEALSKKSRKAA